jgi:hypothetical protein
MARCSIAGIHYYYYYYYYYYYTLILPELLDEVRYVKFQERVKIYVQFYRLHAKLFS